MENKNKDEASTGVLVFSLLALVPLVLLNCYVIATLWGWFLVPLGLPAVTMAHAFGIDALLSYLVGAGSAVHMLRNIQGHLQGHSEDQKLLSAAGYSIGAALGAWGAGYIALCLM